MLNNVVPTVQLSEAETRANSIRVQIAMVRSAKEKAKEKREVLDAKLHENTEYHKLALEIESLTSKKTSLKKTLFNMVFFSDINLSNDKRLSAHSVRVSRRLRKKDRI